VALQGPPNSGGMQGNPFIGQTNKRNEFPIFDGGISVFQDTFII